MCLQGMLLCVIYLGILQYGWLFLWNSDLLAQDPVWVHLLSFLLSFLTTILGFYPAQNRLWGWPQLLRIYLWQTLLPLFFLHPSCSFITTFSSFLCFLSHLPLSSLLPRSSPPSILPPSNDRFGMVAAAACRPETWAVKLGGFWAQMKNVETLKHLLWNLSTLLTNEEEFIWICSVFIRKFSGVSL